MTVNGIKAENTELRQEVARLDEALATEMRRSANLASEKADDRVQYSKLRDVCRAQEEAITRLTAEIEKLRAALVRVMIGGNSLAQIIGADHPPYGTSYDEALSHYGGGVKYEAWCCWNAIMEARAELSGDKQ